MALRLERLRTATARGRAEQFEAALVSGDRLFGPSKISGLYASLSFPCAHLPLSCISLSI
jgi:hypothetical protein